MQQWSENFKSWWPMETRKVYQSSAKSDVLIKYLSATWIYKFNPFPTSTIHFSQLAEDLPIECWWYPPKITWTSRSTHHLLHWLLAIQQSKQQTSDKTLFDERYATVQKDRNNIFGGGLLIFIGTDTVFEKLYSLEKVSMEVLSIRLKTTKSTLLELYIVYYPIILPSKTLSILHS